MSTADQAAAFTEADTRNFFEFDNAGQRLRLHYNDVCPPGHAPSTDDVVIMLHGSGPGATGWANFHRNIEPLVQRGKRVILLDCPGWGLSDSVVVTGSRSELNAYSARALMEHLGITQADFIGNSMGAHSTVAFTLAYPDAVRRIVLMGGGVSGPSIMSPMPAEGIKLIQTLYRHPTIENLKKMMQVFVYDNSSLTDELFQTRLDNMLVRKEHLENFVKSLDANPRQFPDQSHRLGEIKAPALIIWGRDDRFMPLDLGLRALWGIKNSQLHVFSQCGHWAQWEHAETFNQLVHDFLK